MPSCSLSGLLNHFSSKSTKTFGAGNLMPSSFVCLVPVRLLIYVGENSAVSSNKNQLTIAAFLTYELINRPIMLTIGL